jgi:hypothetical protein
MRVVEVTDPCRRSELCEAILRALPHWFGIESATSTMSSRRELDTLAADQDGEAGFLLKSHAPGSRGVRAACAARASPRGLGSALIVRLNLSARRQVGTPGEDVVRPDECTRNEVLLGGVRFRR